MFRLEYVLIPAFAFVIPAAILLGHRRPTGPLLACAGASFGAFAVFWLLLGGINSLSSVESAGFLVTMLVFAGGVLLLLAAWTLALQAVVIVGPVVETNAVESHLEHSLTSSDHELIGEEGTLAREREWASVGRWVAWFDSTGETYAFVDEASIEHAGNS
jgi:hypothetical protein